VQAVREEAEKDPQKQWHETQPNEAHTQRTPKLRERAKPRFAGHIAGPPWACVIAPGLTVAVPLSWAENQGRLQTLKVVPQPIHEPVGFIIRIDAPAGDRRAQGSGMGLDNGGDPG